MYGAAGCINWGIEVINGEKYFRLNKYFCSENLNWVLILQTIYKQLPFVL